MGSALKDVNIDDKQFDRLEGMVHSMTAAERKDLKLFNKARVRRIAAGSGTTTTEVNRLTSIVCDVVGVGAVVNQIPLIEEQHI